VEQKGFEPSTSACERAALPVLFRYSDNSQLYFHTIWAIGRSDRNRTDE